MLGEYHISIRQLVEYVFRSGDLDGRFRTASSMIEGTRIHQKRQAEYEENDEKEVPLNLIMEYRDILYEIEGRCDGILHRPEGTVIEEIKSTSGALDGIDENTYPVHWAQAMCYGYIYCLNEGLKHIDIQLTYVQVLTNQTASFRKTLTFKELEQFLNQVLENFTPFATLQLKIRREKLNSAAQIEFPFGNFRKGQRRLIGAAWKTISERKKLFALAPTGIGKTISFIFPSIKMMGEIDHKIERFFYLTAKTITRQVAEDTLNILIGKGLSVKTVTLTAKDKMCPDCTSGQCIYGEGHYDRINAAVLDILENEWLMDRETILEYAQRHRVCPFEYSIELAYLADIVICDYNYIFDPRVFLKRLSDEQKKRTVILVDEAHNLVERGREMFSAELEKKAFLDIKRTYGQLNPELSNAAKVINALLIGQRKKLGERKSAAYPGVPDELLDALEDFVLHAGAQLSRYGENHTSKEIDLLEVFFQSQNFLRIAKYYNEHYTTHVIKGSNNVYLKLFCLDPALNLQKMTKGFASTLFFSATLTPIGYYMDALGSGDGDYRIQIGSPFSPNQLDIAIQPLSTRFHDRSISSVQIARTIHAITKNRGNFLVFFPSYQFLRMVMDELEEFEEPSKILVQNQGMSEQEREDFLSAFEEDLDIPVIGFTVLGGIFSEGIDLVGNRLSGVIIIGVGLPQLNEERNLIRDYYHSNGKNGFDYAYVYPGMNKVLQAAGRLIRSEQDTGTLTLIDDRFLTDKYRSLFPEMWSQFKIINSYKDIVT